MNLLSKHETRRRLLRGLPDSDLLSTLINQWFQSTQGAAVLEAERSAAKPIIDRLFGYHILQVGGSEEHSLIQDSPVGQNAASSVLVRCLGSVSKERATKVASAARATAMGLSGFSIEPMGDDFVTLPISEVGEYWPLVRP